MAGNNIAYQGPPIANDKAVITLDEVQSGETRAPPGTEPYTVQPGDTLYDIARENGYGNPPDMGRFYADNPQYRESERNPDLIWPGEVVFVRVPEGQAPDADGDGRVDPATDTDGDGRPDPVNAEQAAATTDAAAQDVADAEQAYEEYMRTPGPKGLRHEYQDAIDNADKRLNAAMQAEIETGLESYMASHPNASPDDIRIEAERLANEIQGRSGTATEMSQATVDVVVQRATNNVSAERSGIDLDRVAPGTEVRDGPYTETSGPFPPNTNITLRDGTQVAIDENGYPASPVGAAALAPNPATASDARSATAETADSYERAQDIPHQIPERDDIVSERRSQLTQAVQREVELQLQQWLEDNPGASEEEVRQQAATIAEGIQQREGANVVSETTASTAADRAAEVVLSNRYH